MKKSLKIFGTDYDGVIINIESQKAKTFGKLINDKWGIKQEDAAQYWVESGGKSRRYKFEHLYKNQFHRELSDKEYVSIESKYSELLESKYYSKIKLLPGALELLNFVRSCFDYTFVSSGMPMEQIKKLVKLNKVANYFDLVLGTDMRYLSKREHFRKIIKEKNRA